MGGTVSSTSKVAVISKSEKEGVDVDYDFHQVDIIIPRVDDSANCGNISSAVGPFAVDEGLVEPVEPITVVRVLNTNTNKIIEEHVRVKDGKSLVYGDEKIPGVPGTGSRIDMYFEEPGGSVTGKIFPTGNKIDKIKISEEKEIDVTIIDCANPFVFIKAEDLNIKGTELLELNNDKDKMALIEKIRGITAVKLGFVDSWEKAETLSTSIPKVSIISKSQDYTDIDNKKVKKEDMDICVRAISVGSMHKAYPITCYVATGAAAKITGTIVNQIANIEPDRSLVKIGHSSGIGTADVIMNNEKVEKIGVTRTARRIMDGNVYIKND
jgi:2-methylaconitate cis-trans-isomerase PrpF